MKLNKNLGMVLLSIWLVGWGLMGLLRIGGGRGGTVMQIFAIVVAAVILLFDKTQTTG